jgi:hypothetical protein
LTTEVFRNFTADEISVARILGFDLCSSDGVLGVEEDNPLSVSRSRRSPLNASRHHLLPVCIQTRQGFQRGYGFRCENIRVVVFEVASDFQRSR